MKPSPYEIIQYLNIETLPILTAIGTQKFISTVLAFLNNIEREVAKRGKSEERESMRSDARWVIEHEIY